jgi:DNA-directed RNA polymerase sigma subunit (sigma70/sigma32)
LKLHRALAKQPVRFDHSVDYAKLAEDSGFTVQHCRYLMAWSKSVLSFETPMTKNGKLKLGDTLDDRGVISPDQYQMSASAKALVERALQNSSLSREEREALAAAFYDDQTFLSTRKGSPKSVNDAVRYRCKTAIKKLRQTELPTLNKAKVLFESARW